MAQLAIRGHATRGREVINTLKMLGGKNSRNLLGDVSSSCYYIDSTGKIDYEHYSYFDDDMPFTLEKFLEKFPYKVGDRVKTIYGKIGIVSKPIWSNRDNCIRYELEADTDSFYFINELQPHKEETMESKPDLLQQLKEYFDNTPRDILEKEWNELSYLNEIGPSVNEYLECVKKYRQLNQYPKTYKECCGVLDWNHRNYDRIGYKSELLCKLQVLLLCRDAYWKIAGDWKYDVNKAEDYFYIVNKCGCVVKEHYMNFNHILAFPSEEMRDAFYENFKELIESCKELL